MFGRDSLRCVSVGAEGCVLFMGAAGTRHRRHAALLKTRSDLSRDGAGRENGSVP